MTFDFKLFNWTTATAEVTTSLQAGDHDIYYFGEGGYFARAEQAGGFEDLTARINDPGLGGREGEVPLLGSHPGLRPEAHRPAHQLARRGRPVREHGYGPRGRLRRDTSSTTWDTFVDCVKKMTKGTDTYGLGIGIQLGGFARVVPASPAPPAAAI